MVQVIYELTITKILFLIVLMKLGLSEITCFLFVYSTNVFKISRMAVCLLLLQCFAIFLVIRSLTCFVCSFASIWIDRMIKQVDLEKGIYHVIETAKWTHGLADPLQRVTVDLFS